jgi:hypothetical protein
VLEVIKLTLSLLLLLIATSARAENCVWRFVKNLLITEYPKTTLVDDHHNPLVPLRAHIDRDRVMNDFVATGHLELVAEMQYRIIFRNLRYDWTITFLRNGERMTHVDFGGLSDEAKKFWIARVLNQRGLLEYYFDGQFIQEADVPE